MKLDEAKLQEVVEKIAYQQFGEEHIDDLYAKMGILNDYVQEQLRIANVSSMLPDEVPNLFVTLAQQIHYESAINGLDMTSIIECFNELQEAYKKERSNYR